MRLVLSAVSLALLASCALTPKEAPVATAALEPTKGSSVRGTANFIQFEKMVRVTASVSGLQPNGEYGFHIHEAGDCSSGDGMSAKGPFNPFSKAHGSADAAEHHAGDMPSLKANASGHATLVADLYGVTVTPGPGSVMDRGVIVHAQADDFTTQPTGNAGARSACGVVKDAPKEAPKAPKAAPAAPATPATPTAPAKP